MMLPVEKRVTFSRPFVLVGMEGVQPPGTYSVETRQVQTCFFSFLGGRRTSTWIRVCKNHGTSGVLRVVNIDPCDLSAALARDAASPAAAEWRGDEFSDESIETEPRTGRHRLQNERRGNVGCRSERNCLDVNCATHEGGPCADDYV